MWGGAPRRPALDDGGRHGRFVHPVSLLSSFYHTALLNLNGMLSNFSMPWSQGWDTVLAVVLYDGDHGGSSCFKGLAIRHVNEFLQSRISDGSLMEYPQNDHKL